jgi:copper resistance protein D
VPDLLVGARAVQFACSILVAGTAIFSLVIAAPVLKASNPVLATQQRQLDGLMLVALAFAVASGTLWLLVLAARLGQSSMSEVVKDGTAWAVLSGTRFGRISALRLALAVMLTALVLNRSLLPRMGKVSTSAIALLGLGFIASLAWCGHAGAGLGVSGDVHVANDALHLVAAAAWVGGLVPLLLSIRPSIEMPTAVRFHLVRRFSALAMLAVAGLAASGVINTWFMINRVRELVDTDYGRLVLLKVALFLAMLAFATANRLWLTPRLSGSEGSASPDRAALGLLCIFTTIELTLGLAVIGVVAVLGQLEPPGHLHGTEL